MSEKNKKSGIAFAAWCVAALILLIAFLVNGNKIIGNLKSTDFFEKVFGTGTTPEFIKNHKTEEAKSNGLLELEIETEDSLQKPVIPQDPEELSQKEYVFQTPEKNESIESNRTETSVDEKLKETQVEAEKNKNQLLENDFLSAEKEISKPEKEPESVTKPAEKVEPAPAPAPVAINLHIFFVKIDSDGSIDRKEVLRSSTKRNVPLTAAIELLLEGPTTKERNSDYISLVPENTRLLSAYIKNGIAVLNFSENFEYNPYGVEGYLGQLMQIVYTATSFSTVNSVQFLIEGQKKEYLGSEGVWIGSPLARSSFK